MKKNLINLSINIILVFIIVNVIQKIVFFKTSNPDIFKSTFVLLIVIYVANYFLNKKFFIKKSVLNTVVIISVAILMVGLYYFYRVSLNTNFIFMSNEQNCFLFNFLIIAITFGVSIFITIVYAIINFFQSKKNS